MTNRKAPHVDFSLQLGLVCDVETEQQIIDVLKSIVKPASSEIRVGAIVVLGAFSKNDGVVSGMVQMKPKTNPVENYLNINEHKEQAADFIITYSSPPHDGAIIVERSGQILGAGVYLDIEHPALELPDGCGTRHKAAASFSLRKDVHAVITLSEETGIVRVWKEGRPVIETKHVSLNEF